MEQHLLNLISASKKGLHEGEAFCSKANICVEECRSNYKGVGRSWPKLKWLHDQLSQQLFVIEQAVAIASTQRDNFNAYYKFKQDDLANAIEAVNSILEKLKKRKVDEKFLQNRIINSSDGKIESPNSSRESTLFDFVDEHSVHELRERTVTELKEIHKLSNQNDAVAQSLILHLDQFRSSMVGNSMSLEDSGLKFAKEKMLMQMQETNAMAEVLMYLTKHYDKLHEALRNIKVNNYHSERIDIANLERGVDELPAIIKELEESLRIIELASEDVRIRRNVYEASLKDAIKLFTQVESFSRDLEEFSAHLKIIQANFLERQQIVERYIEEMWNLAGWYEEFALSYEHLLLEIQRRHIIRQQHQKMVEDYSKRLQELYLGEIQQQKNFLESHGRYLPMDLCPAIMEPPAKYDIIVQIQPPHLPVIDQENLDEAHNTILRSRQRPSN
ncbi:uncharacterized protein VTP21DRAFT_857 [Calcarisporiella thermophila]|uniref:uncharacterized protein n=1 Tax=Calcarisporiella thermophila TaxID=911321 RepID=UPI00374315E5